MAPKADDANFLFGLHAWLSRVHFKAERVAG